MSNTTDIAVQRVHADESATDVTRSFGLGARTIFTWLRIARKKSIEALSPKLRNERNRTLCESEEQKIKY